MTLSSPTRRRRRKGRQPDGTPTAEAAAWPEEAMVASLMASGFSYQDALHISPRDYRRYTGIFSSWAIPPDDREAGAVAATQADIDAEFGDC